MIGIFGSFSQSDIPIRGDFDGDGKSDYAVWRSNTGVWYWLNSSNGSFHALAFGISNDYPVPGDCDGDGKTDQAVWRSPGVFYVNGSTSGFTAFQFGASGDFPPAYAAQVR